MCGCLSHIPYWGPGLQPRHVPWLGVKLATLWFTGLCSIHWATPARMNMVSWSWISWWLPQPLTVTPVTHTCQQLPVLSQLFQTVATFTEPWIAPVILHCIKQTVASPILRNSERILKFYSMNSILSFYALPRIPDATYSFWRNKVVVHF